MSGQQRSNRLRPNTLHPNTLTERIAYEAARIMIEQGLADFDRARRKAAERTGVHDRRAWPSNEAVQEAVLTQRRLFREPAHAHERETLRHQALQAMRTFAAFSPRLIGSALMGTGDRHAGVTLHLFADQPEDVVFALIEQRMPWHEGEHSCRYPDGQRRVHPVLRFMAGEIPFELIVLPTQARRQPPLDPVTERPQRGANIAAVERMLAEDDAD